jgi:hypothetical protein
MKFNSKRIIDPNVRTKATELLEESIEANFCEFGLSRAFLDTILNV